MRPAAARRHLSAAGAANYISRVRMLASRQLRAMDGYGLQISSRQGGCLSRMGLHPGCQKSQTGKADSHEEANCTLHPLAAPPKPKGLEMVFFKQTHGPSALACNDCFPHFWEEDACKQTAACHGRLGIGEVFLSKCLASDRIGLHDGCENA